MSPTILAAFEETLAQTQRGRASRLAWLRDQLRFMEWIAASYEECCLWSQITRAMVREYIASHFTNCSANRTCLAMQPITQTAGFMAREHQIPNVAEKLGIGAKLVRPPRFVHLDDVVSFVDWNRENEAEIEPGVALQGLAGLSILEALRLTWQNVDMAHGLIEITGEVKNAYRNRVIPICLRVVEALERSFARQVGVKVRELSAPVVAAPSGGSYADGIDSWKHYTRRVKQQLTRWNPKIDWATKDLRNRLPTFAVSNGLQGDLWEQYIGHAPRSVTGRHYVPRLAAVSRGEEAELERQMNLFRNQVVKPLESSMSGANGAQILNFFEQNGS